MGHDLDSDVGVRKNWAKFVLQYVEDGIRDYRNSHPTYIRGCVLFLQVLRSHPLHVNVICIFRINFLCCWSSNSLSNSLIFASHTTNFLYDQILHDIYTSWSAQSTRCCMDRWPNQTAFSSRNSHLWQWWSCPSMVKFSYSINIDWFYHYFMFQK